MANVSYPIHKRDDAEIVESFRRVIAGLGGASGVQLSIRFADGHGAPLEAPLDTADASEPIARLLAAKRPLARTLTIGFQQGANRSHLSVSRGSQWDMLEVGMQDNLPAVAATELLLAVNSGAGSLFAASDPSSVLGAELAEFYSRRENELSRLEKLSIEITERVDAYRAELQERADSDRSRMEAEHRVLSERLRADFEAKLAALAQEKAELDRVRKELDDRDNRHSRRAIRVAQQERLAGDAVFRLSSETIRKRRILHGLFLASTIFFAGVTIAAILEGTASGFDAFRTIRAATGTIGFSATLVFYIRWADAWFNRHANEEVRVREMARDIDRASWIVETALEFKHEGAELPPALLERLSANLFVVGPQAARARHPSEDLASALLSASAGVRTSIPGFGEVHLDRKSIKHFAKETEPASET